MRELVCHRVTQSRAFWLLALLVVVVGVAACRRTVPIIDTAPAPAQADGTILLSWTAPSPNLWFYAYIRDVTAGQVGFSKLPLPITSCCTRTAAYLNHAHLYEFKVAAINSSGEGQASNVSSATAL